MMTRKRSEDKLAPFLTSESEVEGMLARSLVNHYLEHEYVDLLKALHERAVAVLADLDENALRHVAALKIHSPEADLRELIKNARSYAMVHWRYRQQAPPLKAHLWKSPQETLCGRTGRAPVSGNYFVRNEERCSLCLMALQSRGRPCLAKGLQGIWRGRK